MSASLIRRLLLLGGIAAAFTAFFVWDLQQWLTLEALQRSRMELLEWQQVHPWQSAAAYFGLYTVATAFSFPGAVILTLAGGALFGLGWGLLLVSFASSLGATLAMLSARFLLRDWVQQQWSASLVRFNEGMAREGGFYLFTLRLVPAFPFFLINLGMGLTAIPVRTFYWVSQVGMLPGTVVYVNAGAELGKLETLSDVMSLPLMGAFVLLGIFPWLVRRGVQWWRDRSREV